MKSILFVCTGNSARSIIAESIINNEHSDTFKAYSAGSNPSGKINEDIKEYLENVKKYDLKDYSSKNFQKFIDEKTKLDHVITVCNNANNGASSILIQPDPHMRTSTYAGTRTKTPPGQTTKNMGPISLLHSPCSAVATPTSICLQVPGGS